MALLRFKNGVSKNIEHYNRSEEIRTFPSFDNVDFDAVVEGFVNIGQGTTFELIGDSSITITFTVPDLVDTLNVDLLVTQTDYNPKYAPSSQTVIDYVYNLI